MKRMIKGNKQSISASAVALFSAQLRLTSPVPPELQRMAFQLSQRSGNVELTSLLVARSDAPSDLVEKYRLITDIPVRVAFLTRPGHSEEFLKQEIVSEKRAGVLSQLVASENATPALISLVGKVFLEKPTRALAEALALVTVDLDPAVTLKLFEVLSPRYATLKQGLQSAVSKLANSLADTSQRDAAARIVGGPELADPFLSRPGLSVDARKNLVQQAFVSRLDVASSMPGGYGGRRSWYADRAVSSAMAMLERILAVPDLQAEVLEELKSVAEHALFDAKEKKSFLARLAGRSTTPETEPIESLVDLARKGDEDALARIIGNESLDLALRLEMVDKYRHGQRITELMPQVRVEVQDAIFLRDVENIHREHGFSVYADPAAAEVRLVKAATVQQQKSGRMNGYYYSPLFQLARIDLSEEAVAAFPWTMVQQLTQNSHYVDQRLGPFLSSIAQMQAERYGEDIEKWETFGILSAEFSGTVGELIDAAEVLS